MCDRVARDRRLRVKELCVCVCDKVACDRRLRVKELCVTELFVKEGGRRRSGQECPTEKQEPHTKACGTRYIKYFCAVYPPDPAEQGQIQMGTHDLSNLIMV